ncbi:hypothetical protein BURPS668_A1056 [Burkholderia pseudomallei 668]|nr:hypothetical protein BURPS668_A1056 [Burkholderia pseudomallei 668]
MSIDALASRSDGLSAKARHLYRRGAHCQATRTHGSSVARRSSSSPVESIRFGRALPPKRRSHGRRTDQNRSVGIRSRRRARPSVRYDRRRARRADFRRAAPASARRGTDAGAPAARFGIPTRAPAAYHSRIAHPQGHRRAPPPTNGQARPPARRSTQES